MRDKISIERVNLLHPTIRVEVGKCIDHIESNLFPEWMCIRVVQGLRTIQYQDELFCQPFDGKDNDGDKKVDEPDEKVTNARGGSSYHNYGLAFDFALLYDLDRNGVYEKISWDILKDYDRDGESDWMEVVKIFKQNGYEWGGDWKKLKDNPHLQKTFGHTIKRLRAKYNLKNFMSGTIYVDLG